MSEIAFARPVRVTDADLPPLTLDSLADKAALHELSPRHYVAWRKLLHHLLKYGQLPVGLKALAAVCKVGPRAFEAMAPLLAPHMDHEPDGRWTHRDVVASRGELPIRPAFELGGTNDLSAKRAQSGRAGAEARWGRKPRLELVGAGLDAGPADGTTLSAAMANVLGADGKTDGETDGAGLAAEAAPDPAFAIAGAMPLASGADGSIDRSFLENPSEDDRSIRAGAGATDGEPDGKTGGRIPDGKTDGAPKQAATAPARSLGEVDEAALIAALRKACGARIPGVLLHGKDLEPLRVLVAEGCELDRDVVPAVANFVAGLREPLRTFGAKAIRDKAVASRDLGATRNGSTPAAMVFVVEGDAPWRAWLRAKGVRSHFTYERKVEGRIRRGCLFSTEWPPEWDAPRLAEAEGAQT